MAETDRISGLIGTLGIKAPVRAATTANVTLSGEQTIDGVALVLGDRVLAKDQTVASENGIYYVELGAWTRAPDFDGPRDVVKGTMVSVAEGTANANVMYRMTTTGEVVFGSTAITFAAAAFGGDIAARIHDAANKVTPVGADEFGIWDSVSGALNRLSITNLVAYLSGLCSAGWNAATATLATLATNAVNVTGSAVVSGAITSSSPSAGVGYATGAGGTVTQITSRTTGVTINALCGEIITDTTALAPDAIAEFTVTNSSVGINDVIILSIRGDIYVAKTYVSCGHVANGSFGIRVHNMDAALNETAAIKINFAVIKAVVA